MTSSASEEGRIAALYRFTLLLFVAIAAARMAFVASIPTPLRDNLGHLYVTIPMLGVGAYYTFIRSRPHIAALFNGIGLLLLATTSSGVASALTAYVGRGVPFADAGLEAADRMLGFDWAALLRLHDSYPYVDQVLQGAYHMIFGQIAIIIVILAFTKQAERLYHFLVAANIALIATCIIAVFFPALGPYEFLHLTKVDHPHIDLITSDKMTAPILWLRGVALPEPMPELTVGLISFPSFHSTTAIIYIWATWRTPFIRWAGLTLNTLMLIATPIHGSHYLVDVFAGIAIAVAALAATGWVFARVRYAPRTALARAEAAA